MAKVIREERVVNEPRDQVVVDNRDDRPRSNTGLIIVGVIILLVLLFLLFGNSFGGDASVPAPSTPTPTTPSPGQ